MKRTRTPNVSESWNSRPRRARSARRGTAQISKKNSYIIMQTTGTVDGQTVQTLKALPDFYHFLKSNTEITPLAGNDLDIIQHFLGLGPRIGPSLVRFDENDRIVVIEGPLKGIEGSIIKVDRRKQRAKIQVEFAGGAHTMDLSFEDIERKS